MEQLYRTHYIFSLLSATKQKQLQGKLDKPPELRVFLPCGDATLTRASKKESATSFVVLQYSFARHRYEHQGILLEAEALERAKQELSLKRCSPNKDTEKAP